MWARATGSLMAGRQWTGSGLSGASRGSASAPLAFFCSPTQFTCPRDSAALRSAWPDPLVTIRSGPQLNSWRTPTLCGRVTASCHLATAVCSPRICWLGRSHLGRIAASECVWLLTTNGSSFCVCLRSHENEVISNTGDLIAPGVQPISIEPETTAEATDG